MASTIVSQQARSTDVFRAGPEISALTVHVNANVARACQGAIEDAARCADNLNLHSPVLVQCAAVEGIESKAPRLAFAPV
jgi:hypothetical protein